MLTEEISTLFYEKNELKAQLKIHILRKVLITSDLTMLLIVQIGRPIAFQIEITFKM